MLGGFLADPTSKGSPASKLFGPGTFFGGENGVKWMRRWKYALPNVVAAILVITAAGVCLLFLEEVGCLTTIVLLLQRDCVNRKAIR